MTGAALGWRSHSGWAVLVAVDGTPAKPRVLARERVQLVDEPLPRMTYHAIEQYELSLRDGKALVGKVRNVPDDLERILVSHSLLHAAEGALYEEVLIDAAAKAGLPAVLVEERTIEIPHAVDGAGKALGPPWQRDHKLAAAAALTVLGR